MQLESFLIHSSEECIILGHRKATTSRTNDLCPTLFLYIFRTDKPSGQIRETNTNKDHLSEKQEEKRGF